jgi:56kDa selenium binding protein (SBP56)
MSQPNLTDRKQVETLKPILMTAVLLVTPLFGPATQTINHSAPGGEKRVNSAPPISSPYLFVWTGDGDEKDFDFLAVIDAKPDSPTYGLVVATLPVGVRATSPHHTEYEFPVGSTLFANGWGAGRTFIIDLTNPRKPRLSGQFTQTPDYGFPHSFARLPNGNVLATFQVKSKGYEPPGGLVELDARGKFLRASSADVPGIDNKKLLWPYSLTILPQIDRVVSTSTEMGLPGWAVPAAHGSADHQHTLTDTHHIQIWSLKDLRLLTTIPLPPSPNGKAQLNPAEPRVLADGTLYVNTFNCGLYRVLGLETADPKAEFVYSFPGAGTKFECAVPVVVGKFWIQTDPSLPGLIALDVSDPAKPAEVSRLVFDKRFENTHWLAADRAASRLVVTGNNRSWVLIVNVDSETGRLTLDENFKAKGADHPGIDFDRPSWPHGTTGKGVVHGALFGPAPK